MPLHKAAFLGEEEILKLLIQNGANVNIKNNVSNLINDNIIIINELFLYL